VSPTIQFRASTVLMLLLVFVLAPSKAMAQTWFPIGGTQVDLTAGTSRIDIDASAGRLKSMCIKAQDRGIVLTRVVVTYESGPAHVESRTIRLSPGERTAPIGAAGEDRVIRSVQLFYKSQPQGPNGRRTATVDVLGMRNAERPVASRPGPGTGTAEQPGRQVRPYIITTPTGPRPGHDSVRNSPATGTDPAGDRRQFESAQAARAEAEARARAQSEALRRQAAEQQKSVAVPPPPGMGHGAPPVPPARRAPPESASTPPPPPPPAPVTMAPPPPPPLAIPPASVPMTRGMRPSAPITPPSGTPPSGGSVGEAARPKTAEPAVPAAGGTPPADKTAEDKPYASVPVLFGTDRKQGETRKAKWGDNVDTYGGESQFKLALGKAIVTVPIQKGVRERGSVPRPELIVFGFRVPWGTEQLDKHFTIYSANTLDEATFLAEVKANLAKSKSTDKHAFLFVHGYNVTFEDSLYRTAQIAHDLEFDGAAFMYSWPSKGDPKAYLYDEDRAKGARPHLRAYLEMISAKTDVKNLHVVAHSKGAELLVDVLNELSATPGIASKLRINEIILAAPDIDRANFEQIATRIVGIAQRGVTLYASNNDKALSLSNTIRLGTVRAGEVPAGLGPVLVKGMDTIDISAASTDFFSSNHITFAERQSLITDMRSILDKGQHPPDLRSLSLFKAITLDRGRYWQYIK
jgi:esterase/lipase superfamily enzyme